MEKSKNSFALLDDEEEDDVKTLVDHIIKKVDNTSMHAQNSAQSPEFVQGESSRRRGGQGRRDGSGGRGYDRDGDSQGGYGRGGQRRNYSRESHGSGDMTEDDGGWQHVKRHNEKNYAIRGRSSEHGQWSIRNGNQGYGGGRRGYGDRAQNNYDAADGQRRSRDGSSSDGGERALHGDQVDDKDVAEDGGRRFQDGSPRGDGYQVRDNDAGSEQQLGVNGGTNEGNNFTHGGRMYRNGNRNYGGERRGYGGYRGRGRSNYQRTGSWEVKENPVTGDELDVKAENLNGSEGDGSVDVEALKVAETNRKLEEAELLKKKELEEKRRKELEEKRKKELEERKKEEEEEAKRMTLAEYEKLLLERRQALESLKTQERRVALDKELEGLQLIERKQEDTDDKQKSEVKLKKKASLENTEKGQKLGPEALEFLKPASFRGTRGSRGGGRGGRGRGDQFSDQTHPRTNGVAPAPQQLPTDQDFPVLGSTFPVPAPAPLVRGGRGSGRGDQGRKTDKA